jgi:RHS repeat-associated protein
MKSFILIPTARLLSNILVRTSLTLLLLSETTFGAGLEIEQVQRAFQIRYKTIYDGPPLVWPNSSGSPSPTPAYPKDGYYGNLNENPDEGVRVVQDLVRQFYSDNVIYTSFVKTTNGYDGIEGSTTIANFAVNDLQTFSTNDVTITNYFGILQTMALQLTNLQFLKVSASQVISSEDTRFTTSAETIDIPAECEDFQECAQSNHGSTPWGYEVRNDGSCSLPPPDPMEPWYPYTKIGVHFENLTGNMDFSLWDHDAHGSAARNTRGKISADLRAFQGGNARIYLKLSTVATSSAVFCPFGCDDSRSATFAQDRPTTAAEGTYGYWSGGVLTIGTEGVTESYVLNSDVLPSDAGSCPVFGDRDYYALIHLYGWEVDDAVVIVNPDFTTTQDSPDACPCTECGEGGNVTPSIKSLHVNIALGSDNFNGSAGFLALDSELPNSDLSKPSSLRYSVAQNVEIVTNVALTHFQFKSSQMLADIQTNSLFIYTIKFHTLGEVGTQDTNGFYQATNAYTTIRVENPDGTNDTDRLRITEVSEGATNLTEYNYVSTNKMWELITGGGLRTESRASVWNTNNTLRTETYLIKGPTNQIVYKELNTYYLYEWGQERLTNIVNPDGVALTNVWSFYTNSATDGGNYRQLKEEVSSSGRWVRYQYDEFGRETNRVMQFLNSAVGSSESGNRQKITIYSTGAPQITIIDKVLGTEIARQYTITSSGEVQNIRCQTAGAAYDASDNLVTIATKYTDGSFAGQLKRVVNPDGTVQIYLYSTNSTEKATVLLSGVSDGSNDTNVTRGTITTTITGLDGKTLSRTVQYRAPSVSDTLIDQDVYTYLDSRNRSYQVVHLDGRTNFVNYACCGLDSEIDPDGTETAYIYDGLKRQIGTLRNGIIITNLLDANGAILSTVRVGTNGGTITLSTAAYDASERMTNSTDALQQSTIFLEGRDAVGQTVRTNILPDLGTRIEIVAQDGTPVKVIGTAVRPVRYTNSVETTGSDTGSFYTQAIKLTTLGSDTGEWTKTYLDTAGRVYKTLFSDGSYYRSWFNSKGQLEKQVDPDGVTTLYAYNDLGEQSFTVLDMDRDGAIDFAGADRITQTTNDVITAHGTTVQRFRQYVWDTSGVDSATLVSTRESSIDGLQTWTHSFGVTNHTQTSYAGSGVRYQTNLLAAGAYTVTRFDYGLQSSIYQYDSTGSQIAGTTFGYDAYGRQSTVTDARNGTTAFTFNSADQVSSTATPSPGTGQNGQITTNYFDVMGRIWKVGLPDNTSVTNEYFTTGDLYKTYGSRTYPVQYIYDAQGRLTNMTTWQNYPTSGAANSSWLYDARGFLTNKIYADNNGPTYIHTAAGKLSLRTWARGVTTTYGYNNAGDLESVTYSDGTIGLTNSYDRVGRLIAVVQGTNTTSMLYGTAGELLSETCNSFTATNIYDSFFRRTSRAVAGYSNTATQYGYDAASRLRTVTNGTATVTYAYHNNSPLVNTLTFKSSGTTKLTTTKSYDYLNRLTQIENAPQSGSVSSFAYAYNDANQRTAVTNSNSRWSYQYDSLGQIISGRNYWTSDSTPVAGQNFEYSFDDIGNRKYSGFGGGRWGENLGYSQSSVNSLNQYTGRTVPSAVEILGSATNQSIVTVNSLPAHRKSDYYRREITVDNRSSAVYQSITNVAVLNQGTNADIVTNITGNIFIPQTPEIFQYDLDGNLTNDGRWTYVWDAENRLLNMTANSSIPSAARLKLDFAYDCRGRRNSKLVSDWTGSNYVARSTNKFVYDGWNLIAEMDPANTAIRSYSWGSDLSGTMQNAGGVGGLLALNTGSNTYFGSFDGNGNLTEIINASNGSQEAAYRYGPFGELITTDLAAAICPLQYSTKYHDSESDLIYYGVRFYKTQIGRWLNSDPTQQMNDGSSYTFVRNDPIHNVDALGEKSITFTYYYDGLWKTDPGYAPMGDHIRKLYSVLQQCKTLKNCSCENGDYDIDLRSIQGGQIATLLPKDGKNWDVKNQSDTKTIEDAVKQRYTSDTVIVIVSGEDITSAVGWTEPGRRGFILEKTGGENTFTHELGHVLRWVGKSKVDPDHDMSLHWTSTVMAPRSGSVADCQLCRLIAKAAK